MFEAITLGSTIANRLEILMKEMSSLILKVLKSREIRLIRVDHVAYIHFVSVNYLDLSSLNFSIDIVHSVIKLLHFLSLRSMWSKEIGDTDKHFWWWFEDK